MSSALFIIYKYNILFIKIFIDILCKLWYNVACTENYAKYI